MQNYAQRDDIDHYSIHITYLSFQLLRNHRILKHINYSFLYLIVLVKPELSMHGPIYFICFLTNISLRSDRFTKQSFAKEHKFLPDTFALIRKKLCMPFYFVYQRYCYCFWYLYYDYHCYVYCFFILLLLLLLLLL